jgi:hypothetical protein
MSSGPHTEGPPVPAHAAPVGDRWPAPLAEPPANPPVLIQPPPDAQQVVTIGPGQWAIIRLPMATSDARFNAVVQAFSAGPAAGRVYVVATDSPIVRA